ncbi:MAG: hypothetical protein J6Y28_00600 [Acholeplasmatales bacterium]|nr:hypothetical protein [Acholeplasmatales bacterium]
MKKMILALCLAGCLVGCKSKKEAKKKSEIKTSPTIVKTSFKYDGKGYLKESILYAAGKDGVLTESSNSYEVSNDSGKKIYDAYFSYENGAESSKETNSYTYDENGNLIAVENFYRLKLSTNFYDYNYRTEYIYEGSLLKKTNRYNTSDNAKKFVGTVDYEYDANNNLISEMHTSYNSLYDDGDLEIKYEYKYDSNNQKISYKMFSEDDNGNLRTVPDDEYIYEYDENKNMTKERCISTYFYLNTTITNETQYKYENNKLVEEVYYAIIKDGDTPNPSNKKIYTYDKKGNKSSVLSYYYDSSKSTFVESQKSEYSYNDKGEETLETLYSFDDRNWALVRKTETSYKMIG